VTSATRAGVTLTSTTGDPVNNHTVANDGRTAVIVENTGSTVARTVTATAPEPCGDACRDAQQQGKESCGDPVRGDAEGADT
jgi:hypothetical protein